jgi:hypothetical protein
MTRPKLDTLVATHVEILRRVEEKQDEMHLEMKQEFDKVKAKQDYTNGRIRSTELWINRLIGGLIILSMFIVPVVVEFLKRNLIP